MNVLHLWIILLVLILKILIGLHLVVYFHIIMVCELHLLLLKWLLELQRLWDHSPILIYSANWRRQAYFAAIRNLSWVARIIILSRQAILMILWWSHALLLMAVLILFISRIVDILFWSKSLRDHLVLDNWTRIIIKILSIHLQLFIWRT